MAEANPKKPFYKNIWFWVAMFVLVALTVFFWEYSGFRHARREIRRGAEQFGQWQQR